MKWKTFSHNLTVLTLTVWHCAFRLFEKLDYKLTNTLKLASIKALAMFIYGQKIGPGLFIVRSAWMYRGSILAANVEKNSILTHTKNAAHSPANATSIMAIALHASMENDREKLFNIDKPGECYAVYPHINSHG